MSLLAAVVAAARPLAVRFEGWRARPYLCPAGVPTQGYGHTGRDVTLASAPWTLEHGEAVLDADLGVYARAVLALSPNLAALPPGVAAALADFCFNLGTTRYKASTLRRRVAAEDWEGVAHELGKWVHGGGRRLPGLVARRKVEAAQIRASVAGNDNREAAPPLGDDLDALIRKVGGSSDDPIGELIRLLQARRPGAAQAA